MQSFYRRSSVDNRLDTLTIWECPGPTKKQTKSQLPSLEHLLEKPGLSYHGAWNLQKHIAGQVQHIWKHHFPWLNAACCPETLNPQELATAGQRFLLLYVSLSILKGCFGGWSPSTTSSMWIWWVLPFSELHGHIEIKIWENLVCHLVFSFFPLIDFN